MRKYSERIADDSVWITATPTPVALTLPVYITEAGHFWAEDGYAVKREMHDSFLFLYAMSGEGEVQTGDARFPLRPGQAAVIDCRAPHQYRCTAEPWEFFWIHFKGAGAQPLFDILYPGEVGAIPLQSPPAFESALAELLDKSRGNDIASGVEASAGMHRLFSTLLKSALAGEQPGQTAAHAKEIGAAVDFIRENYASPISVDDILRGIPLSKYHFIRVFRRVMGVTPYSYLTNYRITASKALLRTTDQPVSEIAAACGFLDTSNFIAQFKRHTGQTPTEYKRDFS